jgi:hypothetical protein
MKKYLVKMDFGYCFRMNVPQDLRGAVGKRELRYSLKTESKALARSRGETIGTQMKKIFSCLRERERYIPTASPSGCGPSFSLVTFSPPDLDSPSLLPRFVLLQILKWL